MVSAVHHQIYMRRAIEPHTFRIPLKVLTLVQKDCYVNAWQGAGTPSRQVPPGFACLLTLQTRVAGPLHTTKEGPGEGKGTRNMLACNRVCVWMSGCGDKKSVCVCVAPSLSLTAWALDNSGAFVAHAVLRCEVNHCLGGAACARFFFFGGGEAM